MADPNSDNDSKYIDNIGDWDIAGAIGKESVQRDGVMRLLQVLQDRCLAREQKISKKDAEVV